MPSLRFCVLLHLVVGTTSFTCLPRLFLTKTCSLYYSSDTDTDREQLTLETLRAPLETSTTDAKPADMLGSFFVKAKAFQKAFDDEVWDLFQGAKERKWSPDRRPKGEQGKSAGPSPASKLSWGGAESLEVYERMIGEIGEDKQSIPSSVPLGSAAVTMYGETGKLSSEEMEEELDQFR